MAKKSPFNIGDIVRCTKTFYDCESYEKDALYLVVNFDSEDENCPNSLFAIDGESDDKSSEWLSTYELKNFEIEYPSPLKPKPKVSVDRDDKEIVIRIIL